MARAAADRIHALTIPTGAGALIVPSATIAEVVNIVSVTAMPLSPPWLLGAISWRTLGVPMVSFEALLGNEPAAPGPLSKAVVFYPLAGRPQSEFFAILSASEPRPQTVDVSAIAIPGSEVPKSPYIAGGMKITTQPLWIPDLEGLKRTFYP